MKQLEGLDSISKRILLNEENLLELCPTIATKYAKYLNSDTRGFGFMSWKAELAYRILSQSTSDTLYFWVDAGCEVSSTPISKLKMRIWKKRLKRNGYLYFVLDTPERDYTKVNLYSYFPKLTPDDVSPQAQTTFFGLFGEVGLAIATRWFDLVSQDINTVNEENNTSITGGIVRHRHDQSVFSLVLKEMGLTPNLKPLKSNLSANKLARYWKYFSEPILANRNRSGETQNPLWR
jgi:hypothetical protein